MTHGMNEGATCAYFTSLWVGRPLPYSAPACVWNGLHSRACWEQMSGAGRKIAVSVRLGTSYRDRYVLVSFALQRKASLQNSRPVSSTALWWKVGLLSSLVVTNDLLTVTESPNQNKKRVERIEVIPETSESFTFVVSTAAGLHIIKVKS